MMELSFDEEALSAEGEQLRRRGPTPDAYKGPLSELRAWADHHSAELRAAVTALTHHGWERGGLLPCRETGSSTRGNAADAVRQVVLPSACFSVGEPTGPQIVACFERLRAAGAPPAALVELWSCYSGSAPDTFVAWPTIEWVKVPVNLETGLPNGTPIAMRHFSDCDHWFTNEDGSWVGEPPFLASDEQMVNLPPCKDCTYRAERSGNDRVGSRLGSTLSKQDDAVLNVPLPILLDIDATDVTATVLVRREQAHLREHLLAGASDAECALCGRMLPSSLLIAAHIVPRRHLDDAQRLDFASAAMLACALGCDSLFELGYVAVDETGVVVALRSAESPALAESVGALLGRRTEAFSPATAARFATHREIHEH